MRTLSQKNAMLAGSESLRRRRQHVIVIGCGNIGSHLVPLLARMLEVARVTFLDCDRYTSANLQSQQITPADVGREKACVQACRARRLRPSLEAVAIIGRLEAVPLGWLHGDVMLTCLDSKEARRCANEIAWHLGIPLLDAGIEASVSLARLSIYQPAPEQPCLECAWDQRDYAQLGVIHPCDTSPSAPPSGASACLGALAATLQAIECEKILAGDKRNAGRQFLIDAAKHRHFSTIFRRHPACRFDHATWKISRLGAKPSTLDIGETFQLVGGQGVPNLGFGGKTLIRQLDCIACGFSKRVVYLQERLGHRVRFCPRCSGKLLAAGFNAKTRLSADRLAPGDANRSLASLGVLGGDVISVSRGRVEKFVELAGTTSRRHQLCVTRRLL